MVNDYPRGSEWRKWDLHVHTPFSYENNFSDWDTFVTKLKEKAVEHDIEAVGINDYFSIDGYKKLLSLCPKETQYNTPYIELTNEKKLYLFPMVELRLDNFTSDNTAVNIHVIFSPDILPDTIRSDFLENLTFSYQGEDHNYRYERLIKVGHAEKYGGGYNTNLDLNQIRDDEKRMLTDIALKIITIPGASFKDSAEKFKEMLKKSKIKSDKYLIIIANKGHGGLSDFKWFDEFKNLSRSGNVRQSLLNVADICFSNSSSDINFLLGKEKSAPREEVINRFGSCKPCIWGSDAHSEDNLFHPSNGNTLDYTWIKADLTFEGLKQIIYEPEVGERVYIGEEKPDTKDSYKVIRKIKFENSQDFPPEIEFNSNLSSIIGSRSSGKSALLAYLAHAVNPGDTEDRMPGGPGEGDAYKWDRIKELYSAEWANGKSSDESQGQVVYIPQNYLFKNSTNPSEITTKIEPVLRRYFSESYARYLKTKQDMTSGNQEIGRQVHQWFELSEKLVSIEDQLKNLGNKQAIEQENKFVEAKIQDLKTKYSLSDNEFALFQEIHHKITSLENRISQITVELGKFIDVSEQHSYFSNVSYTLYPPIEDLPLEVREKIQIKINEAGSDLFMFASHEVLQYKRKLEKEKIDAQNDINKTRLTNRELIEKYQMRIELNNLILKSTELKNSISVIERTEAEKEETRTYLGNCLDVIKTKIDQRTESANSLCKMEVMESIESEELRGIKFGFESGFLREDLVNVTDKVNMREKTDFVNGSSRRIKIDTIRKDPYAFLSAIYSGKQKINIPHDRKSVAIEILSLTERVLFKAEMEGDTIGGFFSTTMTPGKRALFLLRLILAQSDDKWPLLIDQPEDDLDSRSIYGEIVPFIKRSKKKRQIIMVSHNANLVVGADSEQVIVANRSGSDRQNEDGKQFNYLTGSLEHTQPKDPNCRDTLKSQGIREHTCEILDGGEVAFESRKNKYNIK